MPVPVPRLSKPTAHPVVKQVTCGDGQPYPFQSLTRTLPTSPVGRPPSFGTREQWIDSLPTWRRTKPRRIWEDEPQTIAQHIEQDFHRGLAVAGNASAIKGAHAEASIPPLYDLLVGDQLSISMSSDLRSGSDGDADDEMNSDYSTIDQSHLENQSQWSASSPMGVDDGMMQDVTQGSSILSDSASHDKHAYERGAFSPVFEDQSPGTASGPERDSSPIQPITPFGVYVDRAVASQPYAFCDQAYGNFPQNYNYQGMDCGPHSYSVEPSIDHVVQHPQEPAPASALEVVTPSATTGYKKLAEPLSIWVANYVWKVCTTGLALPPTFTQSLSQSATKYADTPPSYLAAAIHSLLLSTLLQPSAVFLALWYIVRLPVYFDATPLGPEYVKEAQFRTALLGDSYTGFDKDSMEASAPFRLIVLGCMLANKWLDDHTFSNKTWNNISNVPIQSLNRLESLTLDIFAYDLTISTHDWSQWLAHMMSHHISLTSPHHPQPISRPSTNPYSIIRRAIDEIIQAPVVYDPSSVPQPVFIGLEERRRDKMDKECARTSDVLEIDLDEDGPLRAEYLPKRRVSSAGSYRTSQFLQPLNVDIVERNARSEIPLPPPAKWSPAGDEPLHREKNRVTGHYVAVQPTVHNIATYPVAYHPPVDIYSQYHWNPASYGPVKPQSAYFDLPRIDSMDHQAQYHPYPYVAQIPISHSRSQSLSYDDENVQPRHHLRSYSQARFEYRCSDLRITANEYVPNQGEAMWLGAGHYQYHGSAFAPIHNVVNYQAAWLRT